MSTNCSHGEHQHGCQKVSFIILCACFLAIGSNALATEMDSPFSDFSMDLEIVIETNREAGANVSTESPSTVQDIAKAGLRKGVNTAGQLIGSVRDFIANKKSYQENWIAVCQALSAQLVVRAEAPGAGVFDHVKCHEKSVDSGKDFIKSRTGPLWVLVIVDRQDKAMIDLYYINGGQPQLESSFKFSFSEKFIPTLAEPNVNKALALALREHMPMMGQIKLQAIQETLSLPVADYTFKGDLTVYELSLASNPHRWVPRVIGFAVNKSEGIDKDAATRTYQLRLHKGLVHENRRYFIHASEGRVEGENGALITLRELMKRNGIEGLVDFLAGFTRASVIGFRTGTPLIRGDTAISKARLYGLIAEVNEGPAAGARWFWDYAPRVDANTQGQSNYFTWNRTSLGWSLALSELEFLGDLIQRIDFVPRVGLMSIDSKLPVQDMESGVIFMSGFKAQHVLDLGLEIGTSYARDSFSFRLWTAYNHAGHVAIGPQPKSVIDSLRGGIDLYWFALEDGDAWKINLLTFAMIESLTYRTSNAPDVLAESLSAELTKVSFLLIYAGGGVTLTW